MLYHLYICHVYLVLFIALLYSHLPSIPIHTYYLVDNLISYCYIYTHIFLDSLHDFYSFGCQAHTLFNNIFM